MNGPGFGEQAADVATAGPRPPRHHLVLANQTVGSAALRAVLVERASTPGASFHLVVPATRISDQQQALVVSEHLRSIRSEDASVAFARHRLDRALASLRRLGLVVSGDVGDPDPCVAVRDALHEDAGSRLPDEIIVSTLPARLPHGVAIGLVRRLRRVSSVPVTFVEQRPASRAVLGTERAAAVVP